MINPTLVRALRKSIANNKYEIGPNGFYFPNDKVQGGGVFGNNLNGGEWQDDGNMLPTEGLNSMLDIALGGVAKQTAWYIVPFATNTAPTNSLTAASFASTQTEFTNYSEATRSLWTPAAAAGGVVSNAATAVSITIGALTGSTNTSIYGLALISASPKSSTAGKLQACALFATPRTGLLVTDILGLRYTLTLTST